MTRTVDHILRDIALTAQLACESHKQRATRIAKLRMLIAQLELPITRARKQALCTHLLAASDAVRTDMTIFDNNIEVNTPINIDIAALNKRVLW